MNTKRFPLYAPGILRIGVSLVYLWFGTQQFLHTSQWLGFIPESILKYSPVDAQTLVHFNGAIEIVFGLALLIGVFSAVSATVLALHMADITFIVGYNAIGVRDFGIVIATFAVAFYGADIWSLESYLTFNKKTKEESDIPSPVRSAVLQPQEAVAADTHSVGAMIDYIKKEQAKGIPAGNIRDSLFLKGWNITEIDKAYKILAQDNTQPLA